MNGETKGSLQEERHTCPCCGYPTLMRRGQYDGCDVCGWEDDGQDDHDADEVYGANGVLSLTTARTNFQKYLYKNYPEENIDVCSAATKVELNARMDMIVTYEEMLRTKDDGTDNELWNVIKQSREKLTAALLYRALRSYGYDAAKRTRAEISAKIKATNLLRFGNIDILMRLFGNEGTFSNDKNSAS